VKNGLYGESWALRKGGARAARATLSEFLGAKRLCGAGWGVLEPFQGVFGGRGRGR